jgi:hypothetical protein
MKLYRSRSKRETAENPGKFFLLSEKKRNMAGEVKIPMILAAAWVNQVTRLQFFPRRVFLFWMGTGMEKGATRCSGF